MRAGGVFPQTTPMHSDAVDETIGTRTQPQPSWLHFSRNRSISSAASASLMAASSPDRFPYSHWVMEDVGCHDRSRCRDSSTLPDEVNRRRASPDGLEIVRPTPIIAKCSTRSAVPVTSPPYDSP